MSLNNKTQIRFCSVNLREFPTITSEFLLHNFTSSQILQQLQTHITKDESATAHTGDSKRPPFQPTKNQPIQTDKRSREAASLDNPSDKHVPTRLHISPAAVSPGRGSGRGTPPSSSGRRTAPPPTWPAPPGSRRCAPSTRTRTGSPASPARGGGSVPTAVRGQSWHVCFTHVYMLLPSGALHTWRADYWVYVQARWWDKKPPGRIQ